MKTIDYDRSPFLVFETSLLSPSSILWHMFVTLLLLECFVKSPGNFDSLLEVRTVKLWLGWQILLMSEHVLQSLYCIPSSSQSKQTS